MTTHIAHGSLGLHNGAYLRCYELEPMIVSMGRRKTRDFYVIADDCAWVSDTYLPSILSTLPPLCEHCRHAQRARPFGGTCGGFAPRQAAIDQARREADQKADPPRSLDPFAYVPPPAADPGLNDFFEWTKKAAQEQYRAPDWAFKTEGPSVYSQPRHGKANFEQRRAKFREQYQQEPRNFDDFTVHSYTIHIDPPTVDPFRDARREEFRAEREKRRREQENRTKGPSLVERVRAAYATLELTFGASREDVKQAVRRLARKHHPDLGVKTDRMAEINAARDFLESLGVVK